MKNLLIIFTLTSVILNYSFSQTKCFPWNEVRKSGITFNELDSIYTDAVNVDTSILIAFKGKEDEFEQAWVKLLQDISDFLRKNNFKWHSPTQCFNVFYFDKDGTIDFYFYNIKDFKKTEEFEKLMNEFIKDYKFSQTAEMKFKQCGPVIFQDKKEKISN